MAFIPVENTVSVELRALYFDQRVENVLYFHNQDGVDLAGMADIADHLDTWWNAFMKPYQSASYVFQEVYVTDLTTAISPTYADTSSFGITGANNVSAGLPGNVAYCISFRTNNRGRSGRGRNYVTGLTELAATGNEIAPATKTALITGYEALLTTLPVGWQWVVVSRYLNGAPRPEGFVQTITAVVAADDYLDSQRRRLTARGN